jgi:hypothetical protein
MGARDRRVEAETAARTTAVRLRAPVSSPVPSAYRQMPFLEALAAATWREVLAACGVEVPKVTDAGFAAALVEILGEPQPAMLIDALETIAEVGTEEGADVLRELEAGVSEVLPDGFPRDATVQEQAARLWCLAQGDELVARRLAVAQSLILARQRKRPTLHFAGKSPRRPKPLKRALPALRTLLGDVFERRGAGGYLEIDEMPDDDRLVLYVIHGSTRRSVVTVNDAETGRERTDVRPAVSDIISYETDTARLELQLASVHVADDYRRVLGLALFEEAAFFAGGGGWDLTPLQRRRGAVFDAAPFSAIESVAMRSCIWAPSSGGRFVLSDPDVLDLVDRHALRFEDGELIEARFAIRIRATGRHRRVTATIRPPNQLLCDDRHRADVTAYFTELGLRAGPAVVDLWSLGDGVHREAAWRAVLGSEGVRDAIAEKILVPGTIRYASLDGVTSSDVVEDEDGDIRIDADGGAHQVPPTDRRGYRLDVAALGKRLGRSAGIAGVPTETHAGLLELGLVNIGEHAVRVIVAHRDPGIRGAALRDAVRPRNAARVVVLVPAGRSMPGVDVAPLDNVISPYRLLGRIATALELEENLPAIEIAPEGARFVVDTKRPRAWLDGVDLGLSDGQFDFAHDIAIGTLRQSPTPTKLIVDRVRSKRTSDAAGRQMKSEFLKQAKSAFAAAGKPVPSELADGSLVHSGGRTRGYLLGVPSFVR